MARVAIQMTGKSSGHFVTFSKITVFLMNALRNVHWRNLALLDFGKLLPLGTLGHP